MIVPGTADDPIQLIDVRDLADWIVHCVENRVVGEFNATGPKNRLSMEAMLAGCREGSGGETRPTWVEPAFLEEEGIAVPIWSDPNRESGGIHTTSIVKALAAGLTFRPIADTARDTMEWWSSLPEDLQTRVLPPISLERETELLAKWKQREG
jgi:2'-hydroxyisoflavone reductase